MQTEQPRTLPPAPVRTPEARNGSEAAQVKTAAADWLPRKDIMNQMLAYSDWWNMPSRRPAKRGPRSESRPRPTDRA